MLGWKTKLWERKNFIRSENDWLVRLSIEASGGDSKTKKGYGKLTNLDSERRLAEKGLGDHRFKERNR
jgi:hypothetical protein